MSTSDQKFNIDTYANNLKNYVAQVAVRNDGYYNEGNGFGGPNSQVNLLRFVEGQLPTQKNLEDKYRFDWISRKVINTIPEDVWRKGFSVNTGDAQLNTDFQSHIEELGIHDKINKALIYSRLYGAGLILLGALDGKSPDQPLDEEKISNFTAFTVLDRWNLTVFSRYTNPLEAKFNEPEIYDLSVSSDGKTTTLKVHETRLLRFDGEFLPDRIKERNAHWDDSVLTAIDFYLRTFGSSLQFVGDLFQDFITKKLKISNLKELIATGNTSVIDTRLQYAISSSVNNGITVIDNDEEFDKIQTPVAGIPELLNLQIELVASAANIPRARLFGQSLGVLAGATETTRTYYDNLDTYRQNKIKPRLERLIKLLFLSKAGPTQGKEPENWKIDFPSLWQLTEIEQADLRNKQANTDQIYVNMGSVSPEEIALSRFRETGYSTETIIDLELREEMIEEQNQEPKEEEIQEIPPPIPTQQNEQQEEVEEVEGVQPLPQE